MPYPPPGSTSLPGTYIVTMLWSLCCCSRASTSANKSSPLLKNKNQRDETDDWSPGAASTTVNLQLATIDSAFSPTPRAPSPPRHCDTCFCPLPYGDSSAMCPACPERAAKLGRPSYVPASVKPPSGGGPRAPSPPRHCDTCSYPLPDGVSSAMCPVCPESAAKLGRPSYVSAPVKPPSGGGPRAPSPPRHCDTCFCPLPDGVSSAMCPSCPERAAKLGRPSWDV